MHLLVAACTDVGMRRTNNEDRLLTHVFEERGGRRAHLLAVADGVGGGPSGEIASATAVATLREWFDGHTVDDARGRLTKAAQAASDAILNLARASPVHEGMSSTLVAALVQRTDLYVANVGDSRAYLIRDRVACRLTTDHTLAEEFVLAGTMSQKEADQSRQRHVLTRSLGAHPSVEVDTFGPQLLREGDAILLCSDGLYGVVPDTSLAEICADNPPQDAAELLIGLANQNGGPDNISVIIAAVGRASTER